MKENFESAITKIAGKRISQELLQLRFGENEKKILRLFYNERFKVRRKILPKFYIYAHLCEHIDEDKWFFTMCSADDSIANLELLQFIQKSKSETLEKKYGLSTFGKMAAPISGIDPNRTKGLEDYVGQSRESYELTTTGLEVLMLWHPPIALHLRAWIAVMPPWIVLLSSITGGVAAIWKIVELVL